MNNKSESLPVGAVAIEHIVRPKPNHLQMINRKIFGFLHLIYSAVSSAVQTVLIILVSIAMWPIFRIHWRDLRDHTGDIKMGPISYLLVPIGRATFTAARWIKKVMLGPEP